MCFGYYKSMIRAYQDSGYPHTNESPDHSRTIPETPEDDLAQQLENELFYHIKTGDVNKLKQILADEDNADLLFPSRIRQNALRYSMRAAQLMTLGRYASIQGGCSSETTRSILAANTETLEGCHNIMQTTVVLKRCLIEFASLTRGIRDYNNESYSLLVNRCINRILERMPERITLTELSDSLHVTPKYLSTLFNRDTGMSITDFMQDIRINQAKYLLRNSDMNYPEISNLLCYGSQSYFNQVFKKKTGYTPREYRANADG